MFGNGNIIKVILLPLCLYINDIHSLLELISHLEFVSKFFSSSFASWLINFGVLDLVVYPPETCNMSDC